jgi:hypothetical protein
MWNYVILFVVSYVLTALTAPKPQRPEVGTVEAPTAEVGRSIPVLFGTRWLAQPNVVWYGDISTSPVKSSSGKK